MNTLATIDFSNTELIPGSAGWESVKVQVKEALEEYGCFKAVYNKVPEELHKALYTSLAELFDLPLAAKTRNISSKLGHGYSGQHPLTPLYESLGIADPTNFESAESFTNTMWPEGNPSFCETVHSYSKQVAELDKVVRRMVLESFGVEKYLDEHLKSTHYVFRVMKYEAPQTDERHELGLDPHTDMNVVTILSQNQVQGLQVQTKDGQWIDVQVSPNAFVVFSGDSFNAWTNGRVHSPLHRVMMTGNEARYSTGLFSLPVPGHIVKAPGELVDKQYPLLFKPFEFYDLLDAVVADGFKTSLKTHFGA